MGIDMQIADHDALLESLVQLTAHDSNLNPESGSLFARLKAINRTTTAQVRASKHHTAEARLAMDHAHLQLQNLLYERRHLEREIEKCNRFASIYQDVPMHFLEEFKVLAPSESTTDDVLANEHQLMLNRLGFELAERQRLEEQRKCLAVDKEAKMKEYRDLEKLVTDWFSQGTGIELAIADLKKTGNKVALRLGVSNPASKETSPVAPMTPLPEQMEIDKDPQPPPPMSQIPTGPRIRS